MICMFDANSKYLKLMHKMNILNVKLIEMVVILSQRCELDLADRLYGLKSMLFGVSSTLNYLDLIFQIFNLENSVYCCLVYYFCKPFR